METSCHMVYLMRYTIGFMCPMESCMRFPMGHHDSTSYAGSMGYPTGVIVYLVLGYPMVCPTDGPMGFTLMKSPIGRNRPWVIRRWT